MSMPAEILTSNTTLDQLLRGLGDAPAIVVSGISTDSRTLRKGDVFLACQGATAHGIEFLDQAIAAGVAAVVWDSATTDGVDPGLLPVPAIPVEGLAGHIGTVRLPIAGSIHHRGAFALQLSPAPTARPRLPT